MVSLLCQFGQLIRETKLALFCVEIRRALPRGQACSLPISYALCCKVLFAISREQACSSPRSNLLFADIIYALYVDQVDSFLTHKSVPRRIST